MFYKTLRGSSRRECFLLAATTWGVLMVAGTELLSLFSLLRFEYLLSFWLVVAGVSAFILSRFWAGRVIASRIDFLSLNRKSFEQKGLFPLDLIWLFFIGFIILLVGITAIVAPPNTWDSLTYHMPKVAHWIQNHTVQHYPTNIDRQIVFQPGAEFVITHFQILSKSDRFANMIQWFSMLGGILGVSFIAKQLGAKTRAQIVTALFAATIPMEILQGSSTQNDCTAAFWLVSCVSFFVAFMKQPRWVYALAFGAGLGMALLTKGTAYFYAFPFCLWFLAFIVGKKQKSLWKYAAVIGVVVLFVNLGHYLRNYDLHGSPLGKGPAVEDAVTKNMNLPLFLSNVLRNVGMNLGTSSDTLNSFFHNSVYWIHDVAGVDIIDPRSTFAGLKFHVSVTTHEDGAGHFCQIVVILMCIGLLFVSRWTKSRDLIRYLLAVILGFLFFNLMVKWQPYGTRLQLPFFVLMAPFVGEVLSRQFKKKTVALVIITGILISTSMPYVFRNNSRRLVSSKSTIFDTPREEQYFFNERSRMPYFVEAVSYVKATECKDVGLLLGGNSWEYPFWVLFDANNDEQFRLEHVSPGQLSPNRYPLGSFDPCVVLGIHAKGETFEFRPGIFYDRKKDFSLINIFEKRL